LEKLSGAGLAEPFRGYENDMIHYKQHLLLFLNKIKEEH
jgi:hypothetical protein